MDIIHISNEFQEMVFYTLCGLLVAFSACFFSGVRLNKAWLKYIFGPLALIVLLIMLISIARGWPVSFSR